MVGVNYVSPLDVLRVERLSDPAAGTAGQDCQHVRFAAQAASGSRGV
jgi:hypothetical protein